MSRFLALEYTGFGGVPYSTQKLCKDLQLEGLEVLEESYDRSAHGHKDTVHVGHCSDTWIKI